MWRVLYFFFVLLKVAQAHYTVSPVNLTLKPNQRIASLTVTNESAASKILHIKIVEWTQQAGEEVYTNTKNWIVTPTLMTIAPGKKQLIRLAPRKAQKNLTHEKTYRLFLREVPQPRLKIQPSTIQTLLNISIPIFLLPEKPTPSPPFCSAQKISTKEFLVVCENRSNVHQLLTQFLMSNPQGHEKSVPLFQYILPGQTARIKKPIPSQFFGKEKMRALALVDENTLFVDVPWKP